MDGFGMMDCDNIRLPPGFWEKLHEEFTAEGIIPKFKKRVLHDLEIPKHESCYELTLTTPNDDPYQLRQAFQSMCDSAMVDPVMAYACIELTKAGLPHIHAIIFSKKKYLDSNKLKRFTPHRFELKRVRQMDNYINYIKKEDGNQSIIDYCLLKGIPQFWYHGNEEGIRRREAQDVVPIEDVKT